MVIPSTLLQKRILFSILLSSVAMLPRSQAEVRVLTDIGNSKSAFAWSLEERAGSPGAFAIKGKNEIEMRFDRDHDGIADRVILASGITTVEKFSPHAGQFQKIRITTQRVGYSIEARLALELNQKEYRVTAVEIRRIAPLYADATLSAKLTQVSSIQCKISASSTSGMLLNEWSEIVKNMDESTFIEDVGVNSSVHSSCGANQKSIAQAISRIFGPSRSKNYQLACLSNLFSWKDKADELLLGYILNIKSGSNTKVVTCTNDIPDGKPSRYIPGGTIEISQRLAFEDPDAIAKKIFHELIHVADVKDDAIVQVVENCCNPVDGKTIDRRSCSLAIGLGPIGEMNEGILFLIKKLENSEPPVPAILAKREVNTSLGDALKRSGCGEKECDKASLQNALNIFKNSVVEKYCTGNADSKFTKDDCTHFVSAIDKSAEETLGACLDRNNATPCIFGVAAALPTWVSHPGADKDANKQEAKVQAPVVQLAYNTKQPIIGLPQSINPRASVPTLTEVAVQSAREVQWNVASAEATIDYLAAPFIPKAHAQVQESSGRSIASVKKSSGRSDVQTGFHVYPSKQSRDRDGGGRETLESRHVTFVKAFGGETPPKIFERPQLERDGSAISQRNVASVGTTNLGPEPSKSSVANVKPGISNEPVKASQGGRSIASVSQEPKGSSAAPSSSSVAQPPSAGASGGTGAVRGSTGSTTSTSTAAASSAPARSSRGPASLGNPTRDPSNLTPAERTQRSEAIMNFLKKNEPPRDTPPPPSLVKEVRALGHQLKVNDRLTVGADQASFIWNWPKIRELQKLVDASGDASSRASKANPKK